MSAARRSKATVPSENVTTFYPSAEAALAAAAAPTGHAYTDTAWEAGGYLNPVNSNPDDWAGAHADLAAAVEAARTGVDVRVTAASNVTLPAGKGATRSTTYEVAGGRLDVERYRVGEPECMVVRRRRPSPLNIRIAVHNGALAETSAETLRERGRRVLAVLNGLTAAGANVQLDIVSMAIVNSRVTVANIIRVKDFGQYVDARTIAFWIADVAAHRRVGFKLRSLALVKAGEGDRAWDMGRTSNPTQASIEARGWDLYLGSKGAWDKRNLPTVEDMVAEALKAAERARTKGDAAKYGAAQNVELR